MSLQNEDTANIDLPPEYCQYADIGCDFSETCLNCPLPVCVFDEPGGKRRFVKHNRAVEMSRLHDDEGKSVGEIAVIFGVSIRTVQRVLKSLIEEQKMSKNKKIISPLEKEPVAYMIREVIRGI